MKKIFTPIALAALVIVAGCNKAGLPVKFDITPKTIEFTVPVASQAGDLTFVIDKIEYNLDSLAKANSITISQIKSIKVAEAYLDIVDQNSTTFDIVTWAEAYCKVDNQVETKIASKNPIPNDHVRTIKLDVVQQELVSYFKTSSAQVRLSGRTNAPILNPVQMRARFRLNVVGELAQ